MIPGFVTTDMTPRQVFMNYFNDRAIRPMVIVEDHVRVLRALMHGLIELASNMQLTDLMQTAQRRRAFFYSCALVLAAAHAKCLANYPGPVYGLRNGARVHQDFETLLAGPVAGGLNLEAAVHAVQPLANLLALLIKPETQDTGPADSVGEQERGRQVEFQGGWPWS